MFYCVDFDESEKQALRKLQGKLQSPPALTLPWQTGRYMSDNDAWIKQIRCVILQKEPIRPERPTGYSSRWLSKAEKAYSMTRREFLARLCAVLLLMPNLEGFQFTICTEYDALRWILTMTDATGRLNRWRLCSIKFEFDGVPRASIKIKQKMSLSAT